MHVCCVSIKVLTWPLHATGAATSCLQAEVPELLTLLVCCHGARDSRCGTAGPPLAAALLRGVRKHGLQEQVRVLRTSHVGGHKYAGNVLVYGSRHPCDGDWFGGLHAGNAGAFLEAMLGAEMGVDGGAEDPVLRGWWRGRMGLDKEEQLDLYASGGGIEAVEDVGQLSDDDEPLLPDEEEEDEDGEAAGGLHGTGRVNGAAR